MSSFESREGYRAPAERVSFEVIIAGRLSELAKSRAYLIENVPPEHSGEAETIPLVRKIDTRIAYWREQQALISAFEGRDDSSQLIVEYLYREFLRLGQILEELANGQQPYGYSPNEDPADLLEIQLDLTSILRQYA